MEGGKGRKGRLVSKMERERERKDGRETEKTKLTQGTGRDKEGK